MTLQSKQDNLLLSGQSKNSEGSAKEEHVSDKAEGDQDLHMEFLEGCINQNDICNPFE